MSFVNKEKISGYQLFSLLVISRLVSASLLNPTFNLIKTPAIGWVNEIIAGILAIALVGIIVYLGLKFPDKTIIGYAQILLGSVAGKILGVFLVLSFILVAATDMRILGETLITTILPEIPILVFIISTLVLVASLARCGLEVNGRIAGFLMPMMIVLLLLIGALASICTISDFSYLSPFFLPEGPRELIWPTSCSLSSYAHLLVLGMIIPFVNVSAKNIPISLGAVLMAAFLLTFQSLIVASFFGPLMNTLTFPTFV
ncbi:MAG: GerAB/ArcD/ProY family transporter, partial [Syntrophomonadaceae bacterium]|nr:GerAB/ArcD/ProY family transporter [Syntrophomonadaceae bacterium]